MWKRAAIKQGLAAAWGHAPRGLLPSEGITRACTHAWSRGAVAGAREEQGGARCYSPMQTSHLFLTNIHVNSSVLSNSGSQGTSTPWCLWFVRKYILTFSPHTLLGDNEVASDFCLCVGV